jgi:hypothetical protein
MEFLDNNKIVTLPANIKTLISPDFVRESEDGDIPCYVIPPDNVLPDPIGFQYTDPMKQLDGMVKGFNSNTPKGETLLLTNLEDILLPGQFYFKNGLVLLEVTNTGVKYYAWDPEANTYILLNNFNLGAVNFIEPLAINSNVIWIRIEDTDWILRQGRPFVYVQHPYRSIGYTLLDTYIHDGVTTANPAAGADITMQTAHYARIIKNTIIHDNLLDSDSALVNDIFEGEIEGLYTYDVSSINNPELGVPDLVPNYITVFEGEASAMAIKNSSVADDLYLMADSTPMVTVGLDYIFGVRLGYDEEDGRASGQCRLEINWYDSEFAYISSVVGSVSEITKGGLILKELVATAPIGSVFCDVKAVLVTPLPTEALIWDGAYFGVGTELPQGIFNQDGDLEEGSGSQRMLLVKSEPSIIKSDSIPANDLTIIGHYNEGAIGYDKAANLAKECFNQVTQYNKPLIR